jgi:DNA-directed RNA polymerase III subunit RPC2
MINLGLEDLALLSGDNFHRHSIVFLNGLTVGVHRDSQNFIANFKKLRRKGFIDKFVSISEKHRNIYIACDDGRLCRPLIVVEKGRPILT